MTASVRNVCFLSRALDSVGGSIYVNLFARGYHTAYKSADRILLRPYAAIGVPVISRQIRNLGAISWRYSEAGNRWRLGRKCWAIGP